MIHLARRKINNQAINKMHRNKTCAFYNNPVMLLLKPTAATTASSYSSNKSECVPVLSRTSSSSLTL